MSRKVAAAKSATQKPKSGQEARRQEAINFLSSYEKAFRATARRFSATSEDAEDALQRSIEILLTRTPPRELRARVAWMHVVVRHEALRIRRQNRRQALPSGEPTRLPEGDGSTHVGGARPETLDPAELFERRAEFDRFRQAFTRLKPNERRALCLISEGLSYREIADRTGWSRTKINRLLAEGRSKMRAMLDRLETGHRCAELAGPLSRFCDGEASAEEERELRDHLSGCAACRARLRSYRLSSGAAALVLPLPAESLGLTGRLQEIAAWFQSRLPGRSTLTDAVLTVPTGSGGGRGGMVALAKVAIICAGAGGGTAACVATGILPAPNLSAIDRIYSEIKSDDGEKSPSPEAIADPESSPSTDSRPAAPPLDPTPATDGDADQAGERGSDGHDEPARRNPAQAEFGLEQAGTAVRPPPPPGTSPPNAISSSGSSRSQASSSDRPRTPGESGSGAAADPDPMTMPKMGTHGPGAEFGP